MPKIDSSRLETEFRAGSWHNFAILEILILLAVISLLAAEPVPGINETHYLVKAKHALDPTFIAHDLFLQSHDSHWLSAGLAGGLALFLPLTVVAWMGRILSWLFMAWAWRQLRMALGLPIISGAFALASWYFAVDYGHWAGEWAIGGFEGKSLAYPCVIVALAETVRGNWPRAWLWLGTAVAWHPVAGGWAGLSVGIAWLTLPALLRRVRAEFKWLVLAALIGCIGVLPAAFGLNSANQVGNLVASQVHVFLRLSHHLLPQSFAAERHYAAAISLALLLASTGFVLWKLRRPQPESKLIVAPLLWLVGIAWVAVGFSLVGLLIDFGLTKSRPVLASQLLRFYWFRWSDIVVPLAWTLTFWGCVSTAFRPFVSQPQSDLNASTALVPRARFMTPACAFLGMALVLVAAVYHTRANFERRVPAADDAIMAAPGNREIASDRYVDWIAACAWIKENSPPDSVWFTPEFQQTFKWYAQRAEIINWKDVPQDNASVREWYARVVAFKAARSAEGAPLERTSEELLELSRRYKFRWILVDRRIQIQPLLQFEIMYPTLTSNRSFAVFRIPEAHE